MRSQESVSDAQNYYLQQEFVAGEDDVECNCQMLSQFSANQYETPTWRHPLEFSLAFCSSLFRNSGLYLFLSFCWKYGGMSFSTAYFIVMAVVGLPTVLIMTAIGQHSKYGPLGCWNFSPAVKGIGLSLVVISALHRAPNLVVASEGIYLATMLLESMHTSSGEKALKCESGLLSGFCNEAILMNLTSQDDCRANNFTDIMPDWGICGIVDPARKQISSLKSEKHHYLWSRVGVFDQDKAKDNFAGPKLRTTDLLTGKMRRGFRRDPDLARSYLHWNLVTFVFTLSYCGLLAVLMLDQGTLWTVLHALSLSSSACLLLVNCAAAFNYGTVQKGWAQFISGSTNSGLLMPAIWVDALLLALWNTGCSSGELINIAKCNMFGQNFIGSCLIEMTFHCLLNGLNSLFVCIMQVGSIEQTTHPSLLEKGFGYTHMLMEVHPHILVEVNPVFSILPLACFAVDELCSFVSFKCCVVNSMIDLWPGLRSISTHLYLALFCLLIGMYMPLCLQFGEAIVYDYLRSTWGWNNVLLLAIQLLAFWAYVRPAGISVLFTCLGIGEKLSRLSFWWRLCWFFYTPLLLCLAFFVLVLDSLRTSPVWKKEFDTKLVGPLKNATGPLHGLTYSQTQHFLTPWWVVETLRLVTLVPVLVMAALSPCLTCREDETEKSSDEAQPPSSGEEKRKRARRFRDTWKDLTLRLKEIRQH